MDQSADQTIYVANNDGLLEYNGNTWSLYQMPYGTPVKSVMAFNKKVYTGSYMEFGYWVRNEYGVLTYTSISDQLTVPLVEDEDFWNIAQFKDWVLFQSLDRIYIYNIHTSSFQILEVKSNNPKIFEIDGKLYFQSIGKGFFTLENGEPVMVSDAAIFKELNIVGAFGVNNKVLVITEKGSFFYEENKGLTEWNITAENDLSLTKIYSALELHDGSFVLGTISNGIYHLNANGELLKHINQEKGLNNNTILSLFQDRDDNLWLGLDNGVSVINLNSPFKEYIDYAGTIGVVYTAKKIVEILYLGTNQGLFYRNINKEDEFKLIDGTEGQVWALKEIGGTLFCGHHTGTYVVSNGIVNKISNVPGTWDIQSISGKSNLLIQGNYKGLSILEKIDGNWKYRNNIAGFDSSTRFFELVNDYHILVNHDYKGVYDLKLNTDFTKVEKIIRKESKGIGSSLFRYNNEICYSTINGVFKYNRNKEEFLIDSVLTNSFFDDNEHIIGIIRSTNDYERLWGFTKSNIVTVSKGHLSKDPQKIKIPIPTSFRRSMGVLGFESVVHLENELYLIGISNGYINLDLKQFKKRDYQINISSVVKKTLNNLEPRLLLHDNPDIIYEENNVRFNFNVTEYDKYTEVYYQYLLEGLDEEWSSWELTSNVSFDKLPYGSYEFKVRAKVGNDISKNTAIYDFTILRPWYASYWAILFYIIIAILTSLLIHKIYKNYYKKQQRQLIKANNKRLKRKKLKNQKKIVQIKNQQLQELVDSKNRELAISTMSIIKKNEFLSSIKDKLKESADNPQVKSVIKVIDRNINNEDDWKFFESAFNNADKDFLKKVKGKHPELSANDLRLCAYLRLNLSSKEIAPLLNISVRSVEVKRYRLRKKMGLSRESGLSDYILGL
ncbi:triple tyrosine motif-containing protein [Maribacter sp. SA7]|uniref:helix-turn-helix and ligand-binding sensor domain-containing protein n=1 Tax=Maribacter zhoushanensis TaxID=3030012 RepID=UPI0023EAD678|nr:triple tyrosine motif-containing protein [Maribacter zhoushanensis]MDF4201945.1 triple tyrosine motif-containing protein [Maribacter zhoushanensis]